MFEGHVSQDVRVQVPLTAPTQRKNFETLNKMLAREKELDVLYEKVFEEKILGNLSEERFLKLSGKYEEEQFELKAKIKNMKKIVAEEQKHELNADGFLKIVRKYSEVEELTLDKIGRAHV